ncbi:MAG TPA: type II toxin-antitoxin system prevent-host-death family antitoxin [Candidatus Sulfotelmatobacter sp.]|nr:type II toxin-antitoxin system prevent-host-death family antitoxin [Candidatus Sulfotelmatobacter sp.]
MEKAISSADANRKFSQVLRDVREGSSYVVTSHGRPVARISPVRENTAATRARELLLERVRSQPVIDVGHWRREDLYE